MDVDQSSMHEGIQRLDEYSTRLPTPPRINMPPLDLALLPSHQTPPPHFEITHTGDLFQGIDMSRANANSRHPLDIPWNYSSRRQVQRILPFLYLGPTSAAKDHDFLVNEKITCIIAMSLGQPTSSSGTGNTPPPLVRVSSPYFKAVKPSSQPSWRVPNELGVESHLFYMPSDNGLNALFPVITETLNRHFQSQKAQNMHNASNYNGLAANNSTPYNLSHDTSEYYCPIGRAVLCCETGNERSAAACVAYLMTISSYPFVHALNLVMKFRFCVNINGHTQYLLQAYEDILAAQRDVESARANGRADGTIGIRTSNGMSSRRVSTGGRQSLMCGIPKQETEEKKSQKRRMSGDEHDDYARFMEASGDVVMLEPDSGAHGDCRGRNFAPFMDRNAGGY